MRPPDPTEWLLLDSNDGGIALGRSLALFAHFQHSGGNAPFGKSDIEYLLLYRN
jgi:hypothetical protein